MKPNEIASELDRTADKAHGQSNALELVIKTRLKKAVKRNSAT